MNGLRLLELARPVILMPAGTVVAATTAVASSYINMGVVEKLSLLVIVSINGTNAGGSALVTLSQGTSNSATGKALTAALTAADIVQNSTTDVFTRTTALNGTLTLAPGGNGSVNQLMALIDIDPSTMDTNNGFNYLKTTVTGGSVGTFATVIAFQKFARVSSSTAAVDSLA